MYLNIDSGVPAKSSLLTYSSTTATSIPNLYIDGVVFSSFHSSSVNGAVLYSSNSIILTFNNCVFINSTASRGGSLYIDNSIKGNIIINGCSFINNKALNSAGAIYLLSNIRNISIVSSTFYRNTAVAGNAGAIFVYNTTKNFVLTNTTFVSNAASKGAGGCIFMSIGLQKYVTISNSRFISNTAVSGIILKLITIFLTYVISLGGVIYNQNANLSHLTISGCYFQSNTASGGKYTLSVCL